MLLNVFMYNVLPVFTLLCVMVFPTVLCVLNFIVQYISLLCNGSKGVNSDETDEYICIYALFSFKG